MREIKFRVWDNDMRWMRRVASISFARDGVPDGVIAYGLKHNSGTTYLKDGEIVLMQSTGFTNNGQEWYDGDILENDTDWYLIGWSEEEGRWLAIGANSTHETIDLCELVSTETWLQGNIYENPELLK